MEKQHNPSQVYQRKQRLIIAGILALVLVIAAGIFIYWGRKKVVWFCDEIYTYMLSNSAYGVSSRLFSKTWYTSQFVVDDLSCECGKFLTRAKVNVSVDVHPPMYFYLFHLFTFYSGNNLSKWVGLSLNLICFLGMVAAAYFLILRLCKNKYLAGFMAIALSTVPSLLTDAMLLRMYCLMMAWGMIYALLAVLIMQDFWKESKLRILLYIAICLTTAGGFLTHFYFSIFAVVFSVFACCYLLSKKRFWSVLSYGIAMVTSVGISTLVWPFWTDQVFNEYRGEQAFNNAMNLDKLASTFQFGLKVLPYQMFFGLWVVAMIAVL
nr:hypothetical protein [Lachnospiraceae bacterium]